MTVAATISIKDRAGNGGSRAIELDLASSVRPLYRPSVFFYEGWPNVTALRPALDGPDPLSFNAGMDVLSRQSIGSTKAVYAGWRTYTNVENAYWPGKFGQEMATQDFMLGRSLQCLQAPLSTNSLERFHPKVYEAVLRGEHDEYYRNLMRSRPWGSGRTWYDALDNEADDGTKNALLEAGRRKAAGTLDASWMSMTEGQTVPDLARELYRKQTVHKIRVMIDEAKKLGVKPSEWAVGGLLMGYSQSRPGALGWDWYRDNLTLFTDAELEYVMAFFNPYVKFEADGAGGYRPESIKALVDNCLSQFKGRVRRFGIGETALGWDTRANLDVIVGHNEGMIEYTRDVLSYAYAGVIEVIGFFSKPDGPMSKHGSYSQAGRTPSLQFLTLQADRLNRRW